MTSTSRPAWRTSTRSSNGEKCVEVAPCTGGVIMRDSKHPDNGTIVFPHAAWAAFLREACGQSVPTNGIATIAKIGEDTLVEAWHPSVRLRFNVDEWDAFLAGAADGEFDFAEPYCDSKCTSTSYS